MTPADHYRRHQWTVHYIAAVVTLVLLFAVLEAFGVFK